MSLPSDTIECSHFFRGKAGPTIRILLYTDDPIRVKDDVVKNWSLGVMLQHIETHIPAFANLCFNLVSRNSSASFHADQRIDDLIRTGNYHQIWFFGVHQGNRESESMVFLNGGPRSELDEFEIAALKTWMEIGEEKGQRGGGVLMTGDHAEALPGDALLSEPAPASGLWGLGRALGQRVPRAGRMRQWDGPSRNGQDRQNTNVSADGNFNNPGLQFDDRPQHLNLARLEQGQRHPLFFYQRGTFVEVFPDHMHEGAISMPNENDLADDVEWPNAVRPEVVARGTDNSRGVEVDLVAAYDGDAAGVGRIVADSTWHHYFNINLNRFIPPGAPGSPTDQLGQFYANLAIWLTPLSKRREMANAMINWLATPRSPLEEIALAGLNAQAASGLSPELGEKAYQVLEQVASPCEINELCSLLSNQPTAAMGMPSAKFVTSVKLASLIEQQYEKLDYAKNPPAELELTTT